MLDVGTKIINPRSGSEVEVVELGDDKGVIRFTMNGPSRAPDFPEHFHEGWTEEFRVLSGSGTYKLGGKEGTVSAGETLVFPERIKHIHPYNTGSDPMVIEQHASVTGHDARAIRDTFGFFFTMFEWEAAGKIKLDRIGLPKHPMKFAAAGRVLARAGGYDARMPKAFADIAGKTVGRLALGLGYEVIDPKYR